MYVYSLTQWILFFFCYCFLGWVWECIYISVGETIKKRKATFINRGFLHGPVIPIYGFGAISILLTTLPLREKNTFAIYVIGALTATLLELVTGSIMERLFKVKYWDYSEWPLNYHGHICFFVSLFWGLFSVLLVKIIHLPIESIIFKIPSTICSVVAFFLVALFGYDFKKSLNEAMCLKDILESLTENNNVIRRLENRINAIVAFSPLTIKNEVMDLKLKANERTTYNIERMRCQNEERIRKLKEYISLPEFDKLPDKKDIIDILDKHHNKFQEKNTQIYTRAIKMLKRNPSIISVKHKEAIEILRDIIENKK